MTQFGEGRVSPYGSIATEVGSAALSAAEALAREPIAYGSQRRWHQDDHDAFHKTLVAANLLKRAGAQQLIDGAYRALSHQTPEGVQDAMVGSIDTFHHYLPFTEAERDWLIMIAFRTMTPDDGSMDIEPQIPAQRVRRRTETWISAGEMVEMDGRTLLGRWWAWRHGAREFGNKAAAETVRDSLAYIGATLLPASVEPQARD